MSTRKSRAKHPATTPMIAIPGAFEAYAREITAQGGILQSVDRHEEKGLWNVVILVPKESTLQKVELGSEWFGHTVRKGFSVNQVKGGQLFITTLEQ